MKHGRNWINGVLIVLVLGAIVAYCATQMTGDVGPRKRGLIREAARELERQQATPDP